MTNNHFSSTLTCGWRWIFCLATLLASAAGCGSSSQRLTQLQNENDRLLSEYRAQRDQVTQLNEKLAVVQNRLAESEKLLARQSPIPSSRLSRLNDPGSLASSNAASGAPSIGLQSRGTPSGSAASNSASRSPTSPLSRENSSASANSESELFWRPMRRESN